MCYGLDVRVVFTPSLSFSPLSHVRTSDLLLVPPSGAVTSPHIDTPTGRRVDRPPAAHVVGLGRGKSTKSRSNAELASANVNQMGHVTLGITWANPGALFGPLLGLISMSESAQSGQHPGEGYLVGAGIGI